MPNLNIRDLSEEEYAAVGTHAAAASVSREEWARRLIRAAIAAPVIAERWAYKALGPGKATVQRHSDHPNGVVVVGSPSQEQAGVMERVKLLARRNEPGDREEVVELLRSVFEIVVEVGL